MKLVLALFALHGMAALQVCAADGQASSLADFVSASTPSGQSSHSSCTGLTVGGSSSCRVEGTTSSGDGTASTQAAYDLTGTGSTKQTAYSESANDSPNVVTYSSGQVSGDSDLSGGAQGAAGTSDGKKASGYSYTGLAADAGSASALTTTAAGYDSGDAAAVTSTQSATDGDDARALAIGAVDASTDNCLDTGVGGAADPASCVLGRRLARKLSGI